ncbi:MAG: ribosome silencing factor [Candidatus Margulisbacteria bacterium]|nr:ribosome silencing factor [Candidatus Margulisiibacteriota bacterium]
MEQVPEFLTKSIEFLDAKKTENIVVLDLRDVANIADYFVVSTAANAPHLKSLGDGMQRLCKDNHYRESRHAGDGHSGWVIADYDGVMVHIFSSDMREIYDLEKLWKDAKRVEL